MAHRRYGTLDGLRGIAAFIVLIGHLAGPYHVVALHGYLAVDLFFLMSGFVIAASYEAQLQAGGGVAAFLAVRLKRLWPLYALSFAVGLGCYAVVRAVAPTDNFLFPAMPVATVTLMSVFFLPQLVRYGGGAAFPLNPAAWSLSVEIFGNLIYAVTVRSLTERTLKILSLTGAVGLAVVLYRCGSLDVGPDVSDLARGYIRFAFAFPLGVLLHRLDRQGRLPSFRLPAWAVVAIAALAMTGLGPDSPFYDFAVVTLLFPVLVIAAIGNGPPPRAASIFAWAGAVSYPLYILHGPVTAMIFSALPRSTFHVVLVLCLPPVFVAAAALAEHWFDRPVRRWLQSLPPLPGTFRPQQERP
ncbi:MAG TPA: acyltransferase [Rhizomicrobium sp.]